MVSTRRISVVIAVALLALLLPAAHARAQFGLGGPEGRKSAEELVKVRLLADVEQIVPGRAFHLVVLFDIEPQWHVYWKNPGVSGLPTDVRVTAPAGFVVGAPRFTRPREINGPDGLNYGYEGQGALFVPVTAPASLEPGRVSFEARARYLVCKRSCLMGDVTRKVAVEVAAAGTEPAASTDRAVVAQSRRLPQRLEESPGGRVEFDGAELRIIGPAGGLERLTFFPVPMPGVEYGTPRIDWADGRFDLRVPVEVRPADALGEPIRIEGLVALGMKAEDPSYDFELPLSTSTREHSF